MLKLIMIILVFMGFLGFFVLFYLLSTFLTAPILSLPLSGAAALIMVLFASYYVVDRYLTE